MPNSAPTVKPCAICDESNQVVAVLHRLADFDVLLCRSCGLPYVNQTFDIERGEGIPEGFEATYLPAERSFLARFERDLEYIERFTKKGYGKLLDVGCGVGYFLRVVRNRGWIVSGLDLDKAAVDIARRHNLDVHWATAEENPFSDDQFDVVTLFNVIEHLSAPRTTLEAIQRVLRPGGLFVLETPTDDFALKHPVRLLYRLSRGKITWPVHHFFGLGPGRHVYRFSRKTIAAILDNSGLRCRRFVPVRIHPFDCIQVNGTFGSIGQQKWLIVSSWVWSLVW